MYSPFAMSILKIITLAIFLNLPLPMVSIADDLIDGHKEFSKGKYDIAIKNYLNALQNSKHRNCNILYRIGLSYFLNGTAHSAIDYFVKAKECNPNIFIDNIFRVPSAGMESTLLIGDHVIVDRDFYKHASLTRFDVVVVVDPTKKNNLLIKRIIGLPGETIEIKDNEVYIEGKKLSGDRYGTFNKPSFEKAVIINNYGPTTIPVDRYFVLGDNRNMTFDSRHFGFVAREGIQGKVLIIYGSLDSSQDPPVKREERTGMVIK